MWPTTSRTRHPSHRDGCSSPRRERAGRRRLWSPRRAGGDGRSWRSPWGRSTRDAPGACVAWMPERVEADVCIVGAGYAGLTGAGSARRGNRRGARGPRTLGGRIWTQHLESGATVDRGGGWLAPSTTPPSASPPRSACRPTRPTWRCAPARRRWPGRGPTRGSSRRSARSPSSRSRGPVEDRPDGEAGPARGPVDGGEGRRVGPPSLGDFLEPRASAPRSPATCSRWRSAGSITATCTRCRCSTCSCSCAAPQPRDAVLDRGRVAGEPRRRRRRARSPNGWRPSSATPCTSARRCGRSPSSTTRGRRRPTSVIVHAPHVVVTVPPALDLEIQFTPALPDGPRRAVPRDGRRARDQDAPRLRRAVLAGRRLQRPDLGAGLARRGHHRRVAGRELRDAGLVHLQPRGRAVRRAARCRAPPSPPRRLSSRLGPSRRHPSRSSRRPWWNEEWTRGCSMAHFQPGILTSYGHLLRQPGRIHWAGTETATTSHGAIDGAVRSGERRPRDPRRGLGARSAVRQRVGRTRSASARAGRRRRGRIPSLSISSGGGNRTSSVAYTGQSMRRRVRWTHPAPDRVGPKRTPVCLATVSRPRARPVAPSACASSTPARAGSGCAARHGVLGTVHARSRCRPGAGGVHRPRPAPRDPDRHGEAQGGAQAPAAAEPAVDPRAALLVDQYDEDWSTLWWVRVHGNAKGHPPTAQQPSCARAFPALPRSLRRHLGDRARAARGHRLGHRFLIVKLPPPPSGSISTTSTAVTSRRRSIRHQASIAATAAGGPSASTVPEPSRSLRARPATRQASPSAPAGAGTTRPAPDHARRTGVARRIRSSADPTSRGQA